MNRLSRVIGFAAMAAGMVVLSPVAPTKAADPAPYYENETPLCTANGNVKPCHRKDSDDAYFVKLAECSVSITNFCFTATKSDGSALPATVKIVAGVSAFKVHTSSVDIAGYESFVNAYYLPSGNTLGEDSWGSSDRPKDQDGNAGKIDLSPALSATDSIKVVVKYKTTGVPQYSVLVSDQGTMNFSMSGQNLTATLEGKPARVAIESATQHINFDTEQSNDTTKPWTDRCGIPSMQFVVCNVETATADALAFFGRTKTFVFGYAAEVPGPIWVSTNATYFHFPNVKENAQAKTKSLEVRTAAPHKLVNGTLHEGNFTAFLPNGILSQWKVEKTEDALKKLLSGSIEKAGSTQSVTSTFQIVDAGVRVVFPKINYSAPTLRVSTVPETADTTTTTTASTTTTTVAATTTTAAPATTTTTTVAPGKTLKRGKSASLTSFLKPVGRGKATWKVTGGCKVSGSKLVAPKKAGSCVLTLRQAKSGSTPASTRTVRIKIS